MTDRRVPAYPKPADLDIIRVEYGITQRYIHRGGRFHRHAGGAIDDEIELIKVFIGIEPPAHWHAVLAETQVRLRHRGLHERVGWMDPDHFDLSLRALGYVRRARTTSVDAVVTRALASVESFELSLDKLSMFQNPRELILQAGVRDDAAALEPL